MALHKDLTGAELHEPKGIESAASGTVYIADGSGSGTWTAKNADNLVFNQYFLDATMEDISTPSDRVFFYVPVKSEMLRLTAVLHGTLTTANAVLSIYVNGVLFGTSLTVVQSGSSAGQAHTAAIVTTNTVNAGSVIEVRTDGASDTATKAQIQLHMRAKA